MSGAMEAASVAAVDRRVGAAEERRVIIASSVGTVFEWYDFYLYAILANFFASLFFPPGNATFQLLGAFGAYAAGFLVRPFGALIFGRIGDLVGRKYTFLITITVMGLATVLVGFLPTYKTIGAAAPLILLGHPRQLPQVPEQQVRLPRAVRRDRRTGRGLVHRPVLRAVLPADLPEARLPPDVHADRALAAHRDAVLHRVRRALGSDRAQE